MRNGTQSECYLKNDHHKYHMITLGAVSIGCGVAAVVAGGYAFWLSRRQITDEAFMNVHDLLVRCHDRMREMEIELNQSYSSA